MSTKLWPCGHLGDVIGRCGCTSHQVRRYRSRLSGPLLDRIDMHINVPNVEIPELGGTASAEPSSSIRKRVQAARKRQQHRFKGRKEVFCNAGMDMAAVNEFCHLGAESGKLLDQSAKQLGLSARAYVRIVKISRTIADLAGEENIGLSHVAEAVQYRREGQGLQQ